MEKNVKEYIKNDIKNYSYIYDNITINIGNTIGKRYIMEDFHNIDYYKNIIIICLTDGHGGTNISKNLHIYLHELADEILLFEKNKINKDIFFKNINNFFLSLDKKFKKFNNQGSTISIIFITTIHIYHINLGDSKMLYLQNKKIIYESVLHRPNNKDEILRIVKTSYIKNNRINNSLSLSRSIGDYKYKLYKNKYNGILSPVSIIPSINYFDTLLNSYIIFSTDGFNDFIDKSYLIDTIYNYGINKIIINNLINIAIKNGSNDNITLIIVKIK